jgi:hypothetical protein
MFPVRYELDFYMPEDEILRSHRREKLKYYMNLIRSCSSLIKHYAV